MRRSAEYRRDGSPYRNSSPYRPQSVDYYHQQQRRSDYYNHPHSGANSGTHLQVPGPEMHQMRTTPPPPPPPHGHHHSLEDQQPYEAGQWRRSNNYLPYQPQHAPQHQEYDNEGYGIEHDEPYYDPATYGPHQQHQEYDDYPVDVQRPQHAYSPPDHTAGSHLLHHDGYFPQRASVAGTGYDAGANGVYDAPSRDRSSEYLNGARHHVPHQQV